MCNYSLSQSYSLITRLESNRFDFLSNFFLNKKNKKIIYFDACTYFDYPSEPILSGLKTTNT